MELNPTAVKKEERKPKWLRVKLPTGENFRSVRKLVDNYKLHTICESGSCPNMGECWGAGTATFMILGNVCTRSCGFCAVQTGRPEAVDWEEPERVARSVKLMKVKHCVLTSVDRDDLADGGSIIWAETVNAVRRISPTTTMETLIPDFKGEKKEHRPFACGGPGDHFPQYGNGQATDPKSAYSSPLRKKPGAARIHEGARAKENQNRHHARFG